MARGIHVLKTAAAFLAAVTVASSCLAQAANPAESEPYQTGHTRDILFVGWSEDSATLVSYSAADGTIRLWDAHNGRLLGVIRYSLTRKERAANEEIDMEVRTLDRYNFELRRISSGALVWRVSRDGKSHSTSTSPDGKWIAEGGRYGDASIAIKDAKTGRVVRRLSGHPGIVYALAFSPQGDRLASANGDYNVTVRDSATGTIQFMLRGHEEPVHSVAFSANAELIASGGDDGVIIVWNVATREPKHVLKSQKWRVGALAFSPDGRRLASGGDDRTIRLWDVDNGSLLATFETPGEQTSEEITICCGSAVNGLAFSPSGLILASGCADGSLFFWDMPAQKLLHTEVNPGADVHAVRFQSEASWIWLSGGGERPALFRTAWGVQNQLEGENADFLESASISSDGLRLAAGSIAGEVAIWDARTGKQLMELDTYLFPHAVVFSPNGKLLATGGEDQTVRVWDTATGTLLWDAAQVGAARQPR